MRLCSSIVLAAVSWACALAPAAREQDYADGLLRAQPGVVNATVGCLTGFLAGSDLCAAVSMSDGTLLRFAGVGYRSFGNVATTILVTEAGGLVPRVISCGRAGVTSAAEFHRNGLFGHHFSPGLLDIADALRRHRDVIEELEFWPRCPQFWDVQDTQGVNHRYCAQMAAAPFEPPPRPHCP